MPFNNVEDCPDVFIYLIQLGKEVSYKRIRAKEVFGKSILTSKDEIHTLQNNRGHGSNKDDDAGVIKAFVGVFNETNAPKTSPVTNENIEKAYKK